MAMKASRAQDSPPPPPPPPPSPPSTQSLDQEMKVYLKIVKTVPMKVKGYETIKNLKEHISQKEGIYAINQNLLFDGNVLVDSQSLFDCGIQSNATLHLFVKNSVPMVIFVKLPSNHKVIPLEASACDTVHNIKLMIQEKEGISSESFTLVFDGNLLKDDRTLASFNIKNYSTINLVFCEKEEISIFVKTPTVEAVKLCVKVMFTAANVKAIVGSMVDVSVNHMSLFYNGKQLEGSKSLAFYDIKEGSRLELLCDQMQIFVKAFAGETLTLDVEECDTVKEINAKVFKKLKKRIPCHVHFNVYYAGKRLEDDRNLASYGIQRNSTLNMIACPMRVDGDSDEIYDGDSDEIY